MPAPVGRPSATRRAASVTHRFPTTARRSSTRRGGAVYARRVGGRQRRIGAGSNPTTDGFGRYVAFERGGQVMQANVSGGGVHTVATGVAPAMTLGGHFVFYAQGSAARLNVKSKPVATCPTGDVVQTASSPHGNYVVFTCSNGGAYLGYVGGK